MAPSLPLAVVFWPRRTGAAPELSHRLNESEAAQVRAILQQRPGSLVVCPTCAREFFTGDDCLTVDGNLGWWRAWRKFHQMPGLLVLAVGESSMAPAYRLSRFCSQGVLTGAFFLEAPTLGRRNLKIARSMASIFCGTKGIAHAFEAHIPLASLIICPPGVELPALSGESSPERIVFCMDQSLAPDSGALLVARAMAGLWQAASAYPWEVRMFGSGPRYGEVLAEAERLGVVGRLSILADQSLPSMLAGCTAWLAPGQPPMELPVTLWGGVAGALPTIAVDSPLHREWLGRAAGDAVPLVDNHNPQDLAGKMLPILADPGTRREMAKAAATLRPEISVARVAEKVWESFARLGYQAS